MFNTIKRIYKNNMINENGLNRAVELGWITEVEKIEILGVQETETITV